MTLPLKHAYFLAGLALAALLAGCGTTPSPTGTQSGDASTAARGTQVTDTRGATCTLTLNGEIHAGTVRRMGVALQDLERASCTSKRLLLNAGPALLGDAITLGAMLRNRGFDTQIQAGTRCETPCLLVFAAGSQRVMPEQPRPAQVVFSRIPPDQDFGHQTCKSEPSRAQQLTLTRYLRAMLPEPTATAVYQKLLSADCRTADTYGAAEALAMGLATAGR
jgi:hypothetical protein